MYYTGAQITIRLLERQGIRAIAGIPGGANLPLYDALRQSAITHILTRHEQGAGFIAQGMARATASPAVCFATSGPGATNLITAIADAKIDSVPIIAITGQVSRSLIGTDAFQEIDMYGLSLPITKHNFLVRNIKELFTVIPEAFTLALRGRPGPVAIDIPKDIQTQRINVNKWPKPGRPAAYPKPGNAMIARIARMVNCAQRPVIYAGGGVVAGNAHKLLYALAKKNSIPVALTLMGLGAMPVDEPLNLGMLGMHGSRSTNLIMQAADLIVVLGARFDDRATGDIRRFCDKTKIIHIDIDDSEIGKLKSADIALCADVYQTLQQLIPRVRALSRNEWQRAIAKTKASYGTVPAKPDDLMKPQNVIKEIGSILGPDAIITTDVGQHQMWAAQNYPVHYPRTFLTSGGLGTMGFGLPAAIGASIALPEKRVACISGDGSILMNIQELATLADLGLNVAIIIMNNGHLGLVRQQQELFYKKKYIASKFKSNPDFARLGRSFGIRSYDLSETRDPRELLRHALRKKGPVLVNVPIHKKENVFPMVAPGAANYEMIGG